MNSLQVIEQACLLAIEEESEGELWRGAYCSLVDPLSVLEMAEIIKSMLAELETHHDAGPLVTNIKARLGIK